MAILIGFELKPCPFCGATFEGAELSVTEAMGEAWVSCDKCKASAEMTGTLRRAVEAWNRRV